MVIKRKRRIIYEKSDEDHSYGYSKEYIYTKVKGIHETGRIIDVRIEETNEEVIGSAVV